VGEYIKSKYKKEEYLELYTKKIPKKIASSNSRVRNYLESLDLSSVKIVFGHAVFNGIEEYFPNRNVEYHTILRNPVDRIISLYNFRRMGAVGQREFPIIYQPDGSVYDFEGELKKEFFIDGRERSFLEWFIYFNNRKKDETDSQSYYDFLQWRNFEMGDFSFIGNESHIKHLPVENQSIKYLEEDRILIKNLLEVFWKEDFNIYAQSFDFERLPEYL
jgi:hypothetical protein